MQVFNGLLCGPEAVSVELALPCVLAGCPVEAEHFIQVLPDGFVWLAVELELDAVQNVVMHHRQPEFVIPFLGFNDQAGFDSPPAPTG